MNKYPDIAHRIHKLAKALRVDQQKLGEMAGVSKQAAGKWFTGETRPQYAALASLKKNAGVNDEWIMEAKEPMFITACTTYARMENVTLCNHNNQAQRLLLLYNKLNAKQQSAILALLETIC